MKVETKVSAAGLGAGASGIVLWVLQTYVFKGSDVPAGLVSLVDLAVPALAAFVSGYLAPHTPRPGEPAAAAAPATSPPPPAR